MKVLLHTYRDIQWILRPYLRLHIKYWGCPITIVCEQDYTECVEEFKGCYDFLCPPNIEGGIIPSGDYGKTLRWSLEQIEDEYVIIMMADYLLTKPVNTEIITQALEYMKTDNAIMRCQIGAGSGMINRAEHTDSYKDIKILEHNFLPSSLTPGLWNKEKLSKLAEGSNTAWDVELNGRKKFEDNKWRSISIDPEPLFYLNSLRGRDYNNVVMTPEIQEHVKEFIPDSIKDI